MKDKLNLFRQALPTYEGLDMIPLAGQVIAGTGSVALNYIDDLRQGALYLLEVTGTSMEYEGIFEGDHVVMRAFRDCEWPREGDLIVTKYLPYDINVDMIEDINTDELAGPTLKVFREKPNGEFHLGWRRDNRAWQHASWTAYQMPGNKQKIVTKYLSPIGRVIDVKRQRDWNLTLGYDSVLLGG